MQPPTLRLGAPSGSCISGPQCHLGFMSFAPLCPLSFDICKMGIIIPKAQKKSVLFPNISLLCLSFIPNAHSP